MTYAGRCFPQTTRKASHLSSSSIVKQTAAEQVAGKLMDGVEENSDERGICCYEQENNRTMNALDDPYHKDGSRRGIKLL